MAQKQKMIHLRVLMPSGDSGGGCFLDKAAWTIPSAGASFASMPACCESIFALQDKKTWMDCSKKGELGSLMRGGYKKSLAEADLER